MVLRLKNWTKYQLAAGIVSLFAVAGAAILFFTPTKPHPLRIGINAWPGYEHLYLAKQTGLFLQEGVEVELIEFSSLLDARRAFERKQIDGLATTAIDVLLSRGNFGKSMQIIQIIDFSEGGDQIVADSTIRTISDLRGRRIGLETGSVSAYVLVRALEKNGIQFKDIEVVSADQTTLADMFDKGAISAIVSYPPYSVTELSKSGRHIVFTSSDIPGEVVDVLAMNEETMRANRSSIQKLLKGYWAARDLAVRDPRRAIPVMSARERLTDSEFVASFRNGIRLADRSSQSTFLKRGGQLESILRSGETVLRATRQIEGDIGIETAWTDLFLTSEASAK